MYIYVHIYMYVYISQLFSNHSSIKLAFCQEQSSCSKQSNGSQIADPSASSRPSSARPSTVACTRRHLDVHPNLPPVPWCLHGYSGGVYIGWLGKSSTSIVDVFQPCWITGTSPNHSNLMPGKPNHTGSWIWAPHCFTAALLAMIVAPREAAVHETWKAKHAYVQPQTYPKNEKMLEQISNHRTREPLVWTAIKGSWAKTSPQTHPTIPTYPKNQTTKKYQRPLWPWDHGIMG